MAQAVGAAAVGIASFLASSIKIFEFGKENFPGQSEDGSTIRVKLGNPGDDDPGMGGKLSRVLAWDTYNNALGVADPGNDLTESGSKTDVTIKTDKGGSRADYVQITAGDDAVCVSWISVTMTDGTPGGAWTGDIAFGCDWGSWHFQGEKAGTYEVDDKPEGEPDKPEGEPKPEGDPPAEGQAVKRQDAGGKKRADYIPKCMWLDQDSNDGTNNNPKALKFRVDAYGEKATDTMGKGKGELCKMSLIGYEEGPIWAGPGFLTEAEKNNPPAKRTHRPRPRHVADRLTVSERADQSAKLLCDHPRSWGWDHVGPDGHCNMETRTFSPHCALENVPGCITIEEGNGPPRILKRQIGLKRSIDVVEREYANITRYAK